MYKLIENCRVPFLNTDFENMEGLGRKKLAEICVISRLIKKHPRKASKNGTLSFPIILDVFIDFKGQKSISASKSNGT